MNENSRYVAGIDIGTTEVRAVVAKFDKEGEPSIVGVASVENSGMKKGIVNHSENTYRAIDKALVEAEKMSGQTCGNIAISVNGANILSAKTDGMVAVSSPDGLIDDNDIERVKEVAVVGKVPEGCEILRFVPYYYNVDNQERVSDPYRMEGNRLEVCGNILSAPISQIENIEGVFERVGDFNSKIYYPSVVASARAVLTEKQKENGVVVVDLGASTTGVAIYEDENLQFVKVIPLGGINITNDLAICLKVSPEVAEEIKIKHGHAFEREENHDIVVKHGREHYSFNTQEIDEIIEARLEEIFDEVKKVLKESGFENQLPSGIVLTGGGAELKGIDNFVKNYLQLATQISKNGIERTVSDKVKKLKYSSAVGLLIEMRDIASENSNYSEDYPEQVGFFAKIFKKKQ